MEEYTLSDIFEKPISGEWGKELVQGEVGTKVIRTTNFTNLGKLNLQDVVERNVDLEKYKNKILKFGDIIIEKSGGSPTQPVGRVVIFDIKDDKEYVCNNFTAILRPKKFIYPKYSLYLLKNLYNKKAVLKFQNKTTGIINLKLNSYISKTKVTLPKLGEQKKIADILDKSQELIDKRKAQIKALDELVKSRFIEMFGNPILNLKGWDKGTIGSVVKSIIAGWSANGEARKKGEGEKAILKVSAVTQGYFKADEYKVIGANVEIKKYVFPKKGDLLFSRANTREMVGATCIINNDYPDLLLPDKLWKVLFVDKVNVFYMKYILSEPSIRAEFSAKSTGTSGSMYNVSMDKFKSIEIPIPPIELQNEFATFVNHLDKLKFEMQTSLEEMENNFDSLMQRAFKGELFN